MTEPKTRDMKIVKLLWTGGWDSTYRLIELSRTVCKVQPIYVYGDGRPSEKYEIRAMTKILSELKNRSETIAELLSIQLIDKITIPLNEEVTNAYDLIHKETNLGSQHEWLARLAFVDPGLEIGTESAPLEISRVLTAIDKFGRLTRTDDGFVLDHENSSKELMLVLGNFKFPIIDKSGHDMYANIRSWKYEDIMEKIWFCHTPIFGKPCGFCHPCELKIETGMQFLFVNSLSSLKRYARRNKRTHVINKIERKISRSIDRIKLRI